MRAEAEPDRPELVSGIYRGVTTGAPLTVEFANEDTTVVSIDGFVRGTGTASCGQDTLMKYRFVLDDTIEFRFAMKPITR